MLRYGASSSPTSLGMLSVLFKMEGIMLYVNLLTIQCCLFWNHVLVSGSTMLRYGGSSLIADGVFLIDGGPRHLIRRDILYIICMCPINHVSR